LNRIARSLIALDAVVPVCRQETSMLPWSGDLAGRIDEQLITSELLRDNPLGDPAERPVLVYLPPGYDDEPDRRYPSVYVIMGYTGYVTMWRNRTAYRQPFPETADQVFAAGAAPPAVVVYVDAWTSYGGSQYVDSPGTGRYHSYLCDEVVPWVDGRYRTRADREHRAITGKSSGGFGAMITPMLRPDLFGAFATHAGDSLYEQCYLRDFGPAVRALRDYDGNIMRWWEDFRSRTAFTKKDDQTLLGILGVAAFSASPRVSPPTPAAGRSCRSTRGRERSARRCGSAGSTGIPCGWCPGTPMPCDLCGQSGSTPAMRTNSSWT
jgi:hypothetical protein